VRNRFTANLGMLFPERPFLERIDAAGAAGFDKVEVHTPYEFSIPVIRDRLVAAGVALTGLNTRPGAPGEFGLAGLPGREAEFREAFDQAVEYALGLGARMIHVTAGLAAPDERPAALATYVENVRQAARSAVGTGLILLLEPINQRDRPGYLVSHSDEMAGIIERIGEPNVRMLFDIYHVQIMEGDLTRRMQRHRDLIAHVQVAAIPSRAEPDEGEVSLAGVFRALESIAYGGLIGLEYHPRRRTEDGLGWLDAYAEPAARLA
jgi:hydroxypyruvate isomerase